MGRCIGKIESFVLSFGILSLAAITIINVLTRSFLGVSLSFAEELSQTLVIAVTFVGVSHGARVGRHIRMSAIYDALKGKWKNALTLIICFGTGLLCAWVGWLSIEYIQIVKKLGSHTPALGLPVYSIYLVVPIGLFMTAIQYFVLGFYNLRRSEPLLRLEEES